MPPTNNIYIEYDGKNYLIQVPESEAMLNINMLYDKYWFIIKNNQKENIEHLADIWLMKKHYGLTYPQHIEKEIQNLM